MFLATLSDEQKPAFLALADSVIRADRRLAPQEDAMLGAMRAEMGLPAGAPVPALDVTDAAAAFDTHRVRVAVMLELVGLSLSDGEMAPEEAALLTEIREALGVSESRFLAQCDWVLRQTALVREAGEMMREEV